MKISTIGLAGSGKTTLANRLAKKHSLPCLHLDELWFKHGGHQIDQSDIAALESMRANMRAEISGFVHTHNAWIVEGNYLRVQNIISDRADMILYLDISLWRRQLNHLRRILRRENRYQEISFLQDLYFTYDMIQRTREGQNRLVPFFQKYQNKITTLRSYTEINQTVSTL